MTLVSINNDNQSLQLIHTKTFQESRQARLERRNTTHSSKGGGEWYNDIMEYPSCIWANGIYSIWRLLFHCYLLLHNKYISVHFNKINHQPAYPHGSMDNTHLPITSLPHHCITPMPRHGNKETLKLSLHIIILYSRKEYGIF